MEFWKAISIVINSAQEIDITYKACAPALTQLFLGQSAENIWKEALEKLSSRHLLKTLCDNLMQVNPTPFLKAALQKVNDAGLVGEPGAIVDTIIMLDRTTLSEKLELLGTDSNTVKVLLVRGEPKTGKSYCRHLFEGMAREKNAQPVYMFSPIVVTLKDVLSELLIAVGDTPAILDQIPLSTDPAWYSTICRRLQEFAGKNKKYLWIAMDDLGIGPAPEKAPLLPKEIRLFFDQFVLHMANPIFSKYFRLMLIHYPDEKLPTKWKRETWNEERINEFDVNKTHLEEMIQNWCMKNGRQIQQDALVKKAEKIIADAEAPIPANDNDQPLSRIERIHLAVADLLKTL